MGYVMIIGNRYREKRHEAGITALEIAKALRIRQGTISCFEYGSLLPPYEVLSAMCEFIGIKVSDIVLERFSYMGKPLVQQVSNRDNDRISA